MSASYHNEQYHKEFTHESLIMSKFFDFLPMTIDSCEKKAEIYT